MKTDYITPQQRLAVINKTWRQRKNERINHLIEAYAMRRSRPSKIALWIFGRNKDE